MTADPVNDAPLSAVERERKRRGGGEIKSDLHGSLPDTARPPWPETGNSEAASGTGAGRSSALSLSVAAKRGDSCLWSALTLGWLACGTNALINTDLRLTGLKRSTSRTIHRGARSCW